MKMTKPCVVLVTGAGGDSQGWGNMQVTEAVRAAVCASGRDCRVVWADDRETMLKGLQSGPCDIVWSSLYFFSDRADIVGIPPDAVWVADVLDGIGMPYIGPSAQTMKNLIGKFATHEILAAHGVRVPRHVICPPSDVSEIDYFPAFVKPNGESRSVGINENSVAEDAAALPIEIVDAAAKAAGQEEVVVKDIVLNPETGKYDVTLVINTASEKFVAPETTVAEFAIAGLAAIAENVGDVTVELPADKVTPGLYYSVEYADNVRLTGATETARSLATAAGVTIRVPKIEAATQFFRIAVNLTAR